MSYEERIEWFWGRVEALRLDSAQIALWFCLLRKFQTSGFPLRCEVENEYLCNLLGMEIRTLRAVRNRLIDNNLIAYEAGHAMKQPAYIINMDLYASMHPTPKKVVKVVQPLQPKPKRQPKPKKVQESVEPVLFKEKKKRLPKKAEQPSPTLEEVVKICTDKGMSEEEAKNFYYYYDAQGWVTTGGQKIRRIDSMVNRWLTNGKGKEYGRANNTNSSKREARNRQVFEDIMSRYK